MSQLDRYGHMLGKLGIKLGAFEESIDKDNDVIWYTLTKWKAKQLRIWISLFDLKITKEKVFKGWLYEKGRIEVEGKTSDIEWLHRMIERMNKED